MIFLSGGHTIWDAEGCWDSIISVGDQCLFKLANWSEESRTNS